jgi:hypothetical protein
MITRHARVYNQHKYRPATAYCINLGKSGTRRSPEEDMARLSPFVSSHLNLYLDMLRIRYVALVWAATRICPLAAMNSA